MTKYLLNIKSSGSFDDFQGNIEYNFDLETPLIFPFLISPIEESKKTEYRKLKIKTNQKNSEFFRDVDGEGGIGNRFTPLENYWNLCVPDDKKGFSMTGYNDELALEDKERKVYLELYHFPRTFISVKPQSISLVIEDSKNPSINIKMEEFETQEGIKIDEIRLEGAKFTTSEYQSLIRKTVKDKKELKFNFRSNNNTYFLKNFEKSIFVIPENSLQQETIVSRNTNNSNSFFSSKILFFVLLGAFLILVLFSIFRLIKIRRISKK